MKTVFIDGNQGTTGLRIQQRLKARADLTLLQLPEEERKLLPARLEMAKQADATVLCLPDDASRELVAGLADNEGRVLDASTAHRTDPRFVYGFPELFPNREAEIAASRRIAVPGCHASGSVALIEPLIGAGVLSRDALLCLTSFTGYSGGGKKMIAQYEQDGRDPHLHGARPYAVSQSHKHLPEIMAVCSLRTAPVFQPVVCDDYSFMLVSLPLHSAMLEKPMDPDSLTEVFQKHYAGSPVIRVLPPNEESSIDSLSLSGKDGMEIFVTGNSERMICYARFDNLGKGASGAAVECLNLALGAPMTAGLEL
ncbi:MAG: N-acetyl-gamma-glutamyl-phosphate reductase [Eubacteriales bacterium]|nr:N-acetyl-gamma-glutamyl-phosphate reductase [Eubacteriales bacterium]